MILNDSQAKAVNQANGRIAILAGPGSGKTRVLIEKVKLLLKSGEEPQSILLLAFSNMAVKEMKERLKNEYGHETGVRICTFHSLAYAFLLSMYSKKDRNKVRPLDEKSQLDAISKVIKENNLAFCSNKEASKAFRAFRNKYPIYIPEKLRLKYVYLFYKYREYCIKNLYIDFDDMIYQYFNLLNDNEVLRYGIACGYKHILVDECQDLNQLQFDLLLLLEEVHHNITIVGDPDQAIYHWRGSDYQLINKFLELEGAMRFDLSENYRSDANIVHTTNRLIRNNQNRIDRESIPMRPAVIMPEYNPYPTAALEAIGIADGIEKDYLNGTIYSENFVLYRKHRASEVIEIELKKRHIPYRKDAQSFFEFMETRIVLNYYNLIMYHDDDLAFEFVHDKPCCGIQIKKATAIAAEENISLFEACKKLRDKKTQAFVQKIEELTELQKTLKPQEFFDKMIKVMGIEEYRSLITNDAIFHLKQFREILAEIHGENLVEATRTFFVEMLFSNEKVGVDEGVKLMTIHQAKGLEAINVYMVGMNGKNYDYSNVDNEEETRVNYVGTTRAKDKLICSCYVRDTEDSYETYPTSIYYRELLMATNSIKNGKN